MIRITGEPGDLIFGFAATSLHRDNRLIYVARITVKVRNGGYYRDEAFALRGDRIYRLLGRRFVRRVGALHHRSDDLVHDLGEPPDYPRANVLLSTDFRYFGREGSADYKARFPLVKAAVEGLGRGHRVSHDPALRRQLLDLADEVWKTSLRKVAGQPSGAPRLDKSHRSKSCGVLTDP